jgi:hypothetical protein
MSGGNEIPVQEIINVGKSFILPVGTPLQIEIEGVTMKLNSMSIGLFPDQYIIIKYPYVSNIGALDHKLLKGNKVSVRYLNGGTIFGFRSDVIGVSNHPFRLIFIEFPTTIVRHSLRETRRVECSLPAELCSAAVNDGIIPDIVHSGIVSDISLSGCAFNMGIVSAGQRFPDIKMNEPVTLALQLPGIEKKFELSGEVRRMQRDAQRMDIGIRFHKIDEETRGGITEFILAVEKFG